MTQTELLLEGFEYELWANTLWINYLEAKGRPDEEWVIMQHVLAAQEMWWQRTQGNSPTAMPAPEISTEVLTSNCRRWQSVLSDHPENPLIAYRRTTGEEFTQRLNRIAAHVIDHGVYHRGQIRGLLVVRGWEDFPETGLGGFYYATGRTD